MSKSWNPGVTHAVRTDVGMRRTNNQDSYCVIEAQSAESFSTRGHLYVVADGMGAHAAGELASQMATELIPMHYFRGSSDQPASSLHRAVFNANHEIHQRGQQNPEFHSMGTTASSLLLLENGGIVAHVGDSRVYRLRQGVLEQLTFDHSLVWEVQASGHVHPGSALGQSLPKNVITRSLGPNAKVNIDVEGPFPVHHGDRFLLCSDGLTGQVEDEEIATLMDCLSEELVSEVLVDLANLRGGPDNTTVIIATVNNGQVVGAGPTAPKPNAAQGDPRLLWGAVASSSIFVLSFVAAVIAAIQESESLLGFSMIAVLVSGVVAATLIASQMSGKKKPSSSGEGPEVTAPMGGKGPYRRYHSKPDRTLFERLGSTVDDLRNAANAKNWSIDWRDIDQLQAKGRGAIEGNDGKTAIRFQAEAIVQTMYQLRQQHNRSAGETAIE